MRFLEQRLGDFAIDAGQADIKAGAKEVFVVREMQIDLGVDGGDRRRSNLSFASRQPECAFETGRPTRREQLLRICAGARRTRERNLNVEAAVRAMRGAVFAPPGGVGLAVYTTFPPSGVVCSLWSWVIALSRAFPASPNAST